MSNILKINKDSRKVSLKVSGNIEYVQDKQDNIFSEKLKLEEHYNKGYSEGYKKASAELQSSYHQKYIEKSGEISSFLMSLNNILSGYDGLVERAVINLSFSIAEKVIRREVERDSNIEALIKDTLSKVLGANNILIRMNPDDIASIAENKNLKSIIESGLNKITIEADGRIEKGGCSIETEIGNADGRVNSQISELKKAMDQLLDQSNDESV